MNPLNLAFLAPIAMAWGTIKTTFSRISSYLFVNGVITGAVADHLHCILWDEWTPLPMGNRHYFTEWHSMKSMGGACAPVVLFRYQGPVIFRKGMKFVIWEAVDDRSGKLRCIRGNVNFEGMVRDAALACYDFHKGEMSKGAKKGRGFYVERFQGENPADLRRPLDHRGETSLGNALQPPKGGGPEDAMGMGGGVKPAYSIYPLIGRHADEIGNDPQMQPVDKHYIDPSLDVLMQEAEAWLTGVEWMRERGIPHRRGTLLEGPPGTGKSSLVRAIAEHYGVPLVIIDLATCSDYDLVKVREITRTPSIVLFEDIDNIFDGRKNIVDRESDKVSFDAFLNLLSGVDAIEGMIFVTTNHPEKLDEALLRPGRIDRRVTVPLLNGKGRHRLAHRIMRGCSEFEIDDVLSTAEDQPAAHFENLCVQRAMRWYWETRLNG